MCKNALAYLRAFAPIGGQPLRILQVRSRALLKPGTSRRWRPRYNRRLDTEGPNIDHLDVKGTQSTREGAVVANE